MIAKGPWEKIFNGPISKSVYNAFFNTYTKFCAFITKCTIVGIFCYAMKYEALKTRDDDDDDDDDVSSDYAALKQ